jgi:hypothetical protein
MLMTLRQALEKSPWRLLLFIGRQRGLALSSQILKTDLVERLAQAGLDPDNVGAALASLTPPEQAALADLAAAGGAVQRRHLEPRHGQLRSPRQTPGHYNAPQVGQEAAELSPLERLRALGLIFYHKASGQLFIPTDVLPHLEAATKRGGEAKRGGGEASPPHFRTSSPVPEPVEGPRRFLSLSKGRASPVDLLCHDLAWLLALLQRDDVALLHGRWLPPRFLAAWGQACAVAPLTPPARSELQTGRRRFLHYLAENAGWVNGPSPVSGPRQAGAQRSPSTTLRTGRGGGEVHGLDN